MELGDQAHALWRNGFRTFSVLQGRELEPGIRLTKLRINGNHPISKGTGKLGISGNDRGVLLVSILGQILSDQWLINYKA
jgi:hypothetical protein